MSLHVLVVEDDADIRELVAEAIVEEGHVVTVADRLSAAHSNLGPRHDVGLILLDLGLPDGDGLELVEQLREGGDGTPVIVLSARESADERVRALETGADDYLVKPFSYAELNARTHAVLRRVAPREKRVVLGSAVIDFEHRTSEWDGERHRLLQKEVELLRFMLARIGRVLRRDELLREVWGYKQAVPPTRTVDTHVFNLRKKLAPPGAPQHLQTVHGVGYRLVLHLEEEDELSAGANPEQLPQQDRSLEGLDLTEAAE